MKILIADPHPEVRSALRLILNRLPEVTEVSEAGSLDQLLAQCENAQRAFNCPHLTLFDPALARASSSLAGLVSALRRLCPRGLLVVMSSCFESAEEILAAGADGYISKTDPPDEVFSAISRFLEKTK